jgi:uncharacterized SAM-binding protein YcdF (DUF218 family)
MPPSRSRLGGRFRSLLLLTFLAGLAGTLWFGVSLGHVLHHEDPLEPADAIFVLGGAWLTRVAEGGDLYREGRAPIVALSRELPDPGEEALRARGLPVDGVTDAQIQALTAMGVPRQAIQVLEPQVATASEATALRELAVARGWHTVIVVTSKLHTTRARLVFRRRMTGTNVQIIMRASRYDTSNVDQWWRERADLRFVLFEVQKLAVYWIGLAD